MKQYTKSKSLYKLLIFRLISFVIFPFFILTYILYYNLYYQISQRAYENSKYLSQQIFYNINNSNDLTKGIADNISKNLSSFLSTPYNSKIDFDKYYTVIQAYAKACTDSRSKIKIFSANETIPMGFGIFYHLSDIKNNTIIKEFLNSNEYSKIYSSESFKQFDSDINILDTEDNIIHIYKIYNSTKNIVALVIIETPERYFIDLSNSNMQVQKYTTIKYNNVIGFNFSNIHITEEDLKNILLFDGFGNFKNIVYLREKSDFPLDIIIITSKDNVVLLFGIFILVFIFFIFLALYLFTLYIKDFENEVNLCLEEMNKSISKQFKYRLHVINNDKIGSISKNINMLLDKIENLVERNIKQEIANKEAQLTALQNQINPHFIYNTLELFSSKMEIYGHFLESEAMTSFGKIFRYNINTKSRFVAIEEEINQAINYINIQKLKYKDINLSVSISKNILKKPIMRFILQPLIENSLMHGITNTNRKSFVVFINAKLKDGQINFDIKDNGIGIKPEIVSELNSTFELEGVNSNIQSSSKSIGLKNINARLKLFYGEDYYLKIESIPNKYTRVLFKIKV